MKSRTTLPIAIVDDVRALAPSLVMLDAGKVYAVLYIDDVPGRPGQMTVRCWLAAGHEHRAPDIEALLERSCESSGCAIVDGARLVRRGAA